MTTKNAGQAELFRFLLKYALCAQMIVNLAVPAYIGFHDSQSMQLIIEYIGRALVFWSSSLTALCLLAAFWFRPLRVVGGLMHAFICVPVGIVSATHGYFWMGGLWIFVYAPCGVILGATGWRS